MNAPDRPLRPGDLCHINSYRSGGDFFAFAYVWSDYLAGGRTGTFHGCDVGVVVARELDVGDRCYVLVVTSTGVVGWVLAAKLVRAR